MPSAYPVYVVDDDPQMREIVHVICENNKLTCRGFESGEKFIEALDDLGPGCVLLDMRMPRLNGFQVREEMKRRERRLPIVAMTGYGDVEMAVQWMRLGAIDFLEKPFETQVLLDALSRAFVSLDEQNMASAP